MWPYSLPPEKVETVPPPTMNENVCFLNPNIDGSYPLEKSLCLLMFFFLLKIHCLNCPSLNVNETKHVSSCPHVFIGYLYFICELLVYILG